MPGGGWRAVIDALREKGVPSMLEHANVIEEQLERHGPGAGSCASVTSANPN